MSFNATIQATLTANNAQFTKTLDNSSAQVSRLEAQMRRAGALPLPGERSARDSAGVFAAQQDSLDKVTAARYRAMEAAKAEESAIRANIRAREDEAKRAAATPRVIAAGASTISGPRSAGSSAADEGGLIGLRKRFLAAAGSIGAGELVKGAGIGALVAGFRAAVTHAQQLRDEARALGKDLDPAVAATARIGDAFGRMRDAGFAVVNQLSKVFVDGVDGLVAAGAALVGVGNLGENLDALARDPQAEAARAAAARAAEQERAAAAAQAEVEFQQALAELEQARVDALKEQMSLEEKIAFAAQEVELAKAEIYKTQADTVAAARAEKDLVEKQAALASLRKDREKELAEERTKALEIQQQQEERISAEKAKQLELEKQRAAAVQRIAEAETKVSLARANYQTALSDQSAASLSEIQGGQRGSARDQQIARQVAELRARAAQARDSGQMTVSGGQSVSVADQLSSRANQLQSGIGTLNTAERNPLGAVVEQLKTANEELAQIRDSLELVDS